MGTVTISAPEASMASRISSIVRYLPVPTMSRERNALPAMINGSFIPMSPAIRPLLAFHCRYLFAVDPSRALLPQVAGDLHRAELWPAHRAELRVLEHVVAQRLVVHLLRCLRVQRELELLLPVEVV